MGRRQSIRKPSIDTDHALSVGGEEDIQGDGPKSVPATDSSSDKHKKYKQNWRLNMLSEPRVVTTKYVTPEWSITTGVQSDALKAQCTDRTEQLALSGMRYLKVNKALYTTVRGPEYGKRMDNYIEKSWNSIYNYYNKSLHDLKKKKAERQKNKMSRQSIVSPDRGGRRKISSKIKKKGSTSTDKSKETLMQEHEDWCTKRSKPKPVAKPSPIDRGPIVDMDEIKRRQDEIAQPKHVYRSPSKDSHYKDPTKVPPAALTYEATDRIKTIAQPSPHRLLKTDEIVPGSVKPSALKYEISDRMKELSTPKPATTAMESDLNEDAFTISPAALKYVATPRMLEMARPKEHAF